MRHLHKEQFQDTGQIEKKVNFPNGESVTYETKTVKVADYSMEEIFTKKLLMMLPFYLMRFEAKANAIDKDTKKLEDFLAECNRLADMLEIETKGRRDNLYTDIVKLIKKVSDYIFRNENKIKKGVDNVMGGKVLILESERLFRKGEKSGIKIGEKKGGNLKVYELVADGTITPMQGANNLGITIEELKKKMEVTGYKYRE